MYRFKDGIKAGLLAAFVFTVISFVLLSAVITFADIPDSAVKAAGAAVFAAACYISGYASTQIARKNGLLQGLCCSGIISALLFISGLIISKDITGFLLTKIILCIIFGSIGGVKGINTKKTNLRRK